MEEWKPIEGHPGYEVSNCGRVRSYHVAGRGSLRRKPRLKHLQRRDGRYLDVTLGETCYRVHVLVLGAFVGPPPVGPTRAHGRHLNDDPLDNFATNLAWGTSAQNQRDRHANDNFTNKGEAHPNARLTADLVRIARRRYADGDPVCDLAREYRINPETLRDAIQLRTWKHVE